jgi:hypothetical protein
MRFSLPRGLLQRGLHLRGPSRTHERTWRRRSRTVFIRRRHPQPRIVCWQATPPAVHASLLAPTLIVTSLAPLAPSVVAPLTLGTSINVTTVHSTLVTALTTAKAIVAAART